MRTSAHQCAGCLGQRSALEPFFVRGFVALPRASACRYPQCPYSTESRSEQASGQMALRQRQPWSWGAAAQNLDWGSHFFVAIRAGRDMKQLSTASTSATAVNPNF